ncbi:MAG: cytochrome oxidase putative small subunit CydP [Burkholderiaceae bacterium]
MTRPARLRWPRLTRLPLALEITLALLLKLVILLALWHAFFSDPQAKNMLVPARQVEQHLLAAAAPAAATSTAVNEVTPSLAGCTFACKRMLFSRRTACCPKPLPHSPTLLPPAGEGSKVSRYATVTLIQPKAQHGSD